MPLTPPELLHVATLCVAWAGVVTLHYWLCGWCAWRLGDPTELPLWLKPWNELMRYGISSLLTLVLAGVWWTAATVAAVSFGFVAFTQPMATRTSSKGIDRRPHRTARSPSACVTVHSNGW